MQVNSTIPSHYVDRSNPRWRVYTAAAARRDTSSHASKAKRRNKLNKTDTDAVNTLDRAQVRYRQSALRPIDPERLLASAEGLIESQSLIDIGVGLALLTGRRPYEIFKLGAIDRTRHAEHVRFVGQAKTKDAPLQRDDHSRAR
jgi:hypothetical protein